LEGAPDGCHVWKAHPMAAMFGRRSSHPWTIHTSHHPWTTVAQVYVKHREHCWWQYRNRKLQDHSLRLTYGTNMEGKKLNFRTDFSARESYEQQDAATGQKPNVGSVCVSIVQHSPTKRYVTTYVKEVISEDDAKGFARKIVTYAKGVHETEEKVTLRTDVHFGCARNKGDARFHHTFHQDIISLYKKGKVMHAYAAWHDGKVLVHSPR
jgi:hypothetical protein